MKVKGENKEEIITMTKVDSKIEIGQLVEIILGAHPTEVNLPLYKSSG